MWINTDAPSEICLFFILNICKNSFRFPYRSGSRYITPIPCANISSTKSYPTSLALKSSL